MDAPNLLLYSQDSDLYETAVPVDSQAFALSRSGVYHKSLPPLEEAFAPSSHYFHSHEHHNAAQPSQMHHFQSSHSPRSQPIVFTNSFDPQHQFVTSHHDRSLALPPLDYSGPGSRHSSFDVSGPATPWDTPAQQSSAYFSLEHDNYNSAVQEYNSHEVEWTAPAAQSWVDPQYQPSTSQYMPATAHLYSPRHRALPSMSEHPEMDPRYGGASSYQSFREMPYFDRTLDTPQYENQAPFFNSTYNMSSIPQTYSGQPSTSQYQLPATTSMSPYAQLSYLAPTEEEVKRPRSRSTRSVTPNSVPSRRRSSVTAHAQVKLGQLTLQTAQDVDQAGEMHEDLFEQEETSWQPIVAKTEVQDEGTSALAVQQNDGRACLIMSPRLGQKSYGGEKRYLFPPPAVLLLGPAWWHGSSSPLSVTVQFSGEGNPEQVLSMDNLSIANGIITPTTDETGPIMASRALASRLYVNNIEASSKVTSATVTIDHHGVRTVLQGPPVKVMSKAVKKKSAVRTPAEMHVTHGSVICLFNRIRTQTVMNNFLCTSNNAAAFPLHDWRAIGRESDVPCIDPASSFEARTDAWDPYIIYLVDPLSQEKAAPDNFWNESYPLPPPGTNIAKPGQVICANQPVILQCLNTGVTSPTMIIRLSDRNLAFGTKSSSASDPNTFNRSLAPGEAIGEEISHLQKIALEVLINPHESYNRQPRIKEPAPIYLARSDDTVGMFQVEKPRKIVSGPKSAANTPSVTPSTSSNNISAYGEDAYNLAPILSPPNLMSNLPSSRIEPSESLLFNGRARSNSVQLPPTQDVSNDGGKVQKHRRGSSAAMARKTSVAGPSGSRKVSGSAPSPAGPAQEHTKWSLEVGDRAVWIITTIDLQRHRLPGRHATATRGSTDRDMMSENGQEGYEGEQYEDA